MLQIKVYNAASAEKYLPTYLSFMDKTRAATGAAGLRVGSHRSTGQHSLAAGDLQQTGVFLERAQQQPDDCPAAQQH